uniref:HDC16559 n=1 Tax=Drosophila melanogaster TaxID=7227 RepID=Q6IIY4_DROME|nr:TPA_inf: HDC16559 [Drosophila melanogaster]
MFYGIKVYSNTIHPAIQPRPRIQAQNPRPDGTEAKAKAKAQTSAQEAGLSRRLQGEAPQRARGSRRRWLKCRRGAGSCTATAPQPQLQAQSQLQLHLDMPARVHAEGKYLITWTDVQCQAEQLQVDIPCVLKGYPSALGHHASCGGCRRLQLKVTETAIAVMRPSSWVNYQDYSALKTPTHSLGGGSTASPSAASIYWWQQFSKVFRLLPNNKPGQHKFSYAPK